MINIARVYDEVDGQAQRVLIDRLWPRGLAKADAPFSLWVKEVAPSSALRKWYDHVEERFDEFAERYRHELSVPPGRQALEDLRDHIGQADVILLTATKAVARSHAVVLKEVLDAPSA